MEGYVVVVVVGRGGRGPVPTHCIQVKDAFVFNSPTACNFLTAGAVAVHFQWDKPVLSVPARLLF